MIAKSCGPSVWPRIFPINFLSTLGFPGLFVWFKSVGVKPCVLKHHWGSMHIFRTELNEISCFLFVARHFFWLPSCTWHRQEVVHENPKDLLVWNWRYTCFACEKKTWGFPGTSSPFMGHQSLSGEFQDSRMQHPFLLGTLALSVVTFFECKHLISCCPKSKNMPPWTLQENARKMVQWWCLWLYRIQPLVFFVIGGYEMLEIVGWHNFSSSHLLRWQWAKKNIPPQFAHFPVGFSFTNHPQKLPMACQIPHPTRVSPSSRGRGFVPNPKEPKIENSGIKQGTFVKRHRIPRPSSLGGLAGWQCVMLKICCVWKGWKVRKSRGWSGWGPTKVWPTRLSVCFFLQMHLELNGYKHKEDHNEWHSI